MINSASTYNEVFALSDLEALPPAMEMFKDNEELLKRFYIEEYDEELNDEYYFFDQFKIKFLTNDYGLTDCDSVTQDKYDRIVESLSEDIAHSIKHQLKVEEHRK